MSKLDIQRVELAEGHDPFADHLAAVRAVALDPDFAVVVAPASSPADVSGLLAAAVLRTLGELVRRGGSQRLGRTVAPGPHLQARLPALVARLVPDGQSVLVSHRLAADDLL